MKPSCLIIGVIVLLVFIVYANAEAKKYNDLVHGRKKLIAKEESLFEKLMGKKTKTSSDQNKKETTGETNEEERGFLGLGPFFSPVDSLANSQTITTSNLAVLNQILAIAGTPTLPTNPGPLTTNTLFTLLTANGNLDSATVSAILTVLGITNPTPGGATLDNATLNLILNAITVQSTTGVLSFGGTEIGIVAAALAGVAGLIALVAPIALGIVIGVLMKKGAVSGGSSDYEYYDIPTVDIGYSAPPFYVPPPVYTPPQTYETVVKYDTPSVHSSHDLKHVSQSHVSGGHSHITGGQSHILGGQSHITEGQSHIPSGQSHIGLNAYANYRRSDTSKKQHKTGRAPRSTANRSILNRMSRTVRGTLDRLSKMYH